MRNTIVKKIDENLRFGLLLLFVIQLTGCANMPDMFSLRAVDSFVADIVELVAGEDEVEIDKEELADLEKIDSLTLLWKASVGESLTAIFSPVADEKSVYVADEDGYLFRFDAETGERVWRINTEKELITFTQGAWEEGRNEIVDFYVWNGKEPENFNSATTFIRGDKIGPELKLLNDARGLYISDYQNYLETKWLKELRGKHKVKVNKKMLKTIKGV